MTAHFNLWDQGGKVVPSPHPPRGPSPSPMKISAFLIIALGLSSVVAARADAPREWIDPQTGHRVIRLSNEPGTSSLYFHQNAYSPDGRKLVVTTPHGIATIDLATRAIEPVVNERVAVIVVGRKSGDVYYAKREGAQTTIYATNLETKQTRRVAQLSRGAITSVNADETLLVGTYGEAEEDPNWQRGGAGRAASPQAAAAPRSAANDEYRAKRADGTPLPFAEAKEARLHEQLARIHAQPPRTLFTIEIATGKMNVVLRQSEWINHVQFSPTDPQLIMFCHEGPWHEVDRLWTIRTDGTGLKKIHTRTMNMEIWGHEFFAGDGSTIWYDLQTPRGEVFWVGGFAVNTGRRTWYAVDRNAWSVHYNVSRDGTMFAGDGGDSGMVAHAPDGKWIYLFRPRLVPDLGGAHAADADRLIHPGRLEPERLVNMSAHDYRLEPNVTFTPDQKWIVFRSNMHGGTQVYAVEVAKAK